MSATLDHPEEMICVLVRYPSEGQSIGESLKDYRTNPSPGSYILSEHRKRNNQADYCIKDEANAIH